MNAQALYDEARAIMGRLPRNIGRAKRLGRLSVRQLAALDRLYEIEEALPPMGEEWKACQAAHYAAAMERYRAEVAEVEAAQRAQLERIGLAVGARVFTVLPGPFPWMAGRRIEGTVRMDKSGAAYVQAGRQRLCPFSNRFRPVSP